MRARDRISVGAVNVIVSRSPLIVGDNAFVVVVHDLCWRSIPIVAYPVPGSTSLSPTFQPVAGDVSVMVVSPTLLPVVPHFAATVIP